jgi:hypothetical protein
MLYYLFTYLREHFNLSGTGVFYYITFRASLAVILSLVISMLFGKRLIQFLQKKQIGETVRELGLEGEQQKKGTPTMGGLIIIAAILIPTLLFARITNVYIILMVVSTIWCGVVGFIDDYIKVFKKNKEGLEGFIPCFPSSLTILKNSKLCNKTNNEEIQMEKKCDYDFVYMNDSIWKPYEQTLEFLKVYYDYEEPKDITKANCFNPKYFCRVVEQELITGFLTNSKN